MSTVQVSAGNGAGTINLDFADLADGSKAIKHVVLGADGNPIVPVADASIQALTAAVVNGIAALQAAGVLQSSLGADFDQGSQVAGKLNIVAATTAVAGKTRFATPAEAAAGTATTIAMGPAQVSGAFVDKASTQTVTGLKSFSSGAIFGGAATAQSVMHAQVSSGTFSIVGRLENDQSGSGAAAVGLSSTSTALSETRSAKAGIALQRTMSNGRGTFMLCNRVSNDAFDLTAGDAFLTHDARTDTVGVFRSTVFAGVPASTYTFGGVNQNCLVASVINGASTSIAETGLFFSINSIAGGGAVTATNYKAAIIGFGNCSDGGAPTLAANYNATISPQSAANRPYSLVNTVEMDINNLDPVDRVGSVYNAYQRSVVLLVNGGGYQSATGLEFAGGGGNHALFETNIRFSEQPNASTPSVGVSSIWDQTTSPTSYKVTGSHVIGIDLSGATFSRASFFSPGFSVDGSGNTSFNNALIYTATLPKLTWNAVGNSGTDTHLWQAYVDTSGRWALTTLNDAQNAASLAILVNRSGNNVPSIQMAAPTQLSLGFTVANLPTGLPVGSRAHVTDASGTPTWSGTPAGGGSLTRPVFYTPSGWIYG